MTLATPEQFNGAQDTSIAEASSHPPFVGLTGLPRRVINACFVQGGRDQGLLLRSAITS